MDHYAFYTLTIGRYRYRRPFAAGSVDVGPYGPLQGRGNMPIFRPHREGPVGLVSATFLLLLPRGGGVVGKVPTLLIPISPRGSSSPP